MSRYGTKFDVGAQTLVDVATQRGHEVERLRLALIGAERERDEARGVLREMLAGSVTDMRRKAPECEHGRWYSITVRGELLARARAAIE